MIMQIEEISSSLQPVMAEPIESVIANPIKAMIAENGSHDKFVRKLLAAIRQLGDIVDDETQALLSHTNPDFNDIKAKKARGLQTLGQLSREREGIELDKRAKAAIEQQLDQLHVKLARNQHLLQTHMEAISELVEMIHEAAHAQETDGTYNPYLQAKQGYKGA